MDDFEGLEKRNHERVPLTTNCPVHFTGKGTKYAALMIDLSEKGARIRLEEHGVHCGVTDGDTLQLDVKTPYGDSTCAGRVIWAQHIDGHFTFGVLFTELSDSPRDPLVSLIDSLF
jgi:hypothetical protein